MKDLYRFLLGAVLAAIILMYAALCTPPRPALPLCGELREQPCRDPR